VLFNSRANGVREHATDRGLDWRQSRGSDSDGEMYIIHEFGDPGSMTGDHRVAVVGVTCHDDEVLHG
jgi:hypothetical protein